MVNLLQLYDYSSFRFEESAFYNLKTNFFLSNNVLTNRSHLNEGHLEIKLSSVTHYVFD